MTDLKLQISDDDGYSAGAQCWLPLYQKFLKCHFGNRSITSILYEKFNATLTRGIDNYWYLIFETPEDKLEFILTYS